MNADPILLTIVSVLSGLLLVAVFVVLILASDRSRLVRRLERLVEDRRGGAHG